MHSGKDEMASVGRPSADSFESVVRDHYERILHSPHFDASSRSREVFRYIIDATLAGDGAGLDQSSIARSVFHRKENFDAILDPIVRVQMGRLRRSLERYYLLCGESEPLRIEIPKGTYAPVFVDTQSKHTAQDAASNSESNPSARAEVMPDWPTLAIYPFETHGDTSADSAAAHLKEQLTLELCRYGGVHVARGRDVERLTQRQQSSVRFEMRGTIRSTTDGYIASARLVDKSTGEQVWSDEFVTGHNAERWSRTIDDVARTVAARLGSEHGTIIRLLARERSNRPDLSGAFSAIMRSHHSFISQQQGDLLGVKKDLERLTILEPEIAIAWTYLSRVHLNEYAFELADVRTPIDKIVGFAYQGVSLDGASIQARCVLARALLVKGESDAARHELEQALRLNPDSLVHREVIGWLATLAGDWQRGLELMRDAIERNPYCLPCVKHGLWLNHFRLAEYEQAYRVALEFYGSMYFWRDLMIASTLGRLGRSAEAEASVHDLLVSRPDFPQRGRILISHFVKSNDIRDRVAEGLSRAGLILN